MSLLLNVKNLSKLFGSKVLFKNMSFSVFKHDRIGLIGPNGSGKSTLLKILANMDICDEGEVSIKRSLKIAYVPQNISYENKSVKEVLVDSLKDEKLKEDDKNLLIEKCLNKFGFNDSAINASTLSGGWQKKLSIAEAVILSPDLLLLDEPTNYLDLESLLWLERYLQKKVCNFILVSHDRYFLQNVCNKIIEISNVYPNNIFKSDGSYLEFLKKKEDFLQGQIKQEKSLNSKARREGEWLKQGAKARTTKSKSRIDKAQEIFEELANLKTRNQTKKVKIDFNSTNRETKKLITLKSVSKSFNGKYLFKNLSFSLASKTRIGLIGPNGCGKTTLLKLLTEEIAPDSGTIKKADNLKIVYFEQHKMKLDDNLTLKEALCPNNEYVTFKNKKIHVNSWCQRFLFSKDALNFKIKTLSGGERARIAIAHLLLEPSDVMLLDEPTNDLDIQTLDVLEESLLDFEGSIILITHDRFLIDRVCNSIISLGNKDQISVFSDYAQFEASKKNVINSKDEKPKQKKVGSNIPKLTFSEKKEYKGIEGNINNLEQEISNLNNLLNQEDVIANKEHLESVCRELSVLQLEVEKLYLRWNELDNKA
ncbi:MAG: Energy-dependent translational throttle protein EttA [Candidatus Anoxychlamydiales bacterium]|nr:Energy-dependent translational throttle protein EttA [Candidatus Anoxychlamydiales bacterium]